MKRIFVLWSIGLVMALGGCSGGGAPAAVSTTLKVEMREFSYSPNNLSVPAGQTITLELTNDGAVQHDFTLLKKDDVAQGVFDLQKQSDEIFFHAALDPGKSGTFTFTAPAEPGTYQILCGIPGHYESGMTGILTVVSP